MQGQKALYAVVEVVAVVRMWKELGHVWQALVGSRIFELQVEFRSEFRSMGKRISRRYLRHTELYLGNRTVR